MKKPLLLLSLFAGMFSYGQITIGTGTAVDGNAGLSTPISNWYATSLSQSIYLASEIGASMNITGIQFELNGTAALTNSNDQIDVWIGHTTKSTYTPVVSGTGADWVSVATASHVVTNGSLTQSGNLVTFTFSTPFAYNGTDNLVVTVDANEPGDDGSSMLYYQTAASPNITSLMIRTDNASDNANPLSPPLNYDGTVTATSVQAKHTRPKITLLGTLGVTENSQQTVALYPNPVKGNLFIESASGLLSADIYTVTGQLVKSAKPEGNKISTEGLSSGMYLVKGTLGNGAVFSQKFVKE